MYSKTSQILLITLLFQMLLYSQLDSIAIKTPRASYKKDIKVGLVLSGGGARVLSAISLLKKIDSLGIRIDYIGGTSMGAIIGAMYASGYSGKQIDSIFRDLQFENLVNKKVSRRYKGLIEKNNEDKYFLSFPLDKNLKPGVPYNLVSTQFYYEALFRIFDRVRNIQDFKDLPIPFYSVATRVSDGKNVEIEQGNLPKVLLASSAFPLLYKPVSIAGELYIDGGVSNNFPIERMKKKGVDYIIGVNLQQPLKQKDDIKNGLDIISQVISYQDEKLLESKKKLADLYFSPSLDNISILSFKKMNDILELGKKESEKKLPKLKKITSLQKEPRRDILVETRDSLTIEDIVLEGVTNYTKRAVKSRMRLKPPIKTSFRKVEAGIERLLSTDDYEDFHYHLENKKGKEYLHINFAPKDDKMFLKLGLHYDNLYKTGVLTNFTRKQILSKNDLISIDVVLGDNFRSKMKYIFNTGKALRFSFVSDYNEFSTSVKLDSDNIAINYSTTRIVNWDNKLVFESHLKELFFTKFGANFRTINISYPNIGQQNLPLISNVYGKSDFLEFFGSVWLDTFDDKYFPKKGAQFFAEIGYAPIWFNAIGDNTSLYIKANYKQVFPLSRVLRVINSAAIGLTIVSPQKNPLQFGLGGYGNDFINNYMSFLGYNFLGISEKNMIMNRTTIDYNFHENHHIKLIFNMANAGSDIFLDGSWIDGINHTGYSIGYGFDSVLGPLEFNYSKSLELKDGFANISLGLWF